MKLTCLVVFLLPLFLLMAPLTASAQEIVAHRGASHLAPENTLASVRLGYALGADAVEVDVQLTKDGQLVVIHDKDTKRTAGGKNLVIAETTAEALRQLEVGSWKDPKFSEEKIPFLEEVFDLVPQDKKLVVELKTGPEILPYLQQLIDKKAMADRLVLISFSKEAIVGAKQRMPNIPAFWLLHNFQDYSLEEAIQIVREHILDGLDVHYKLVDGAFMHKMQEQGLVVWVYTVNDPGVAKKLLELGVQAITTDRPKWLKEKITP